MERALPPHRPADVGRSYDSVIRVETASRAGRHRLPPGNRTRVVMPAASRSSSPTSSAPYRPAPAGMSAATSGASSAPPISKPRGPVRYVEHHLFEHGSAQGISPSRWRRHPSPGGQRPHRRRRPRLARPRRRPPGARYEERSMGCSADGGTTPGPAPSSRWPPGAWRTLRRRHRCQYRHRLDPRSGQPVSTGSGRDAAEESASRAALTGSGGEPVSAPGAGPAESGARGRTVTRPAR